MPTLLSPLTTDHIAFMHRIGVAINARVVDAFTVQFKYEDGTQVHPNFKKTDDNNIFEGRESMNTGKSYTLDIKNDTLSITDDTTAAPLVFYALHGTIPLVLNTSVRLCSEEFDEAHLIIEEISFSDTIRKKQLKTVAAYCLVHAALKSTLALTRQTVVAAMQNLNDTSTLLRYIPVDDNNLPEYDKVDGNRALTNKYAVLGEYRRRVLLTIADVKCNIERSVSTSNMSRSHYCITLQQVAILLPLLREYNRNNGIYRHNNVPTYWGINPTAMVNGNWQLHHNRLGTNNVKIPYVYIACLHLYYILFHGTAYAGALAVPKIDKLPLPGVYQYVYDAVAIEDFWRKTYCNTDGSVRHDLVNYFVDPVFTQSVARQLELAYCNNVCVDSESKLDWSVSCLYIPGLMDITKSAHVVQWTIADDNTVSRHCKIEPRHVFGMLPLIDKLLPNMTNDMLKQTHLIVLYDYIKTQYDTLNRDRSVVAWILLFCDFVRLLSKAQFDKYFHQENIETFSLLLSVTSIYCFNDTTLTRVKDAESPNTHNYDRADIFKRLNVYYKRYQETTLQSFYQNVSKNCDEWCYKVWALHHLYTERPDIKIATETTLSSFEHLNQDCLFHPMLTTKIVLPKQFTDVVMQVQASAEQLVESPTTASNITNNNGYRFALTANEIEMQSNSFCTVVPQFNVFAFIQQHDTTADIEGTILANMFWHKYRCAD